MPTTYAIPDGRVAMAATLYTGTNTTLPVSNAVNGVGFQPDWVWVKNRTTAAAHMLQDSVRGATAYINSNTTSAENTNTASNWFRSFDTSGFTVSNLTTGGANTIEWNNSGYNYVGWQWKAGGTAVSNAAGSITSSVSANTTAGFSVVQFTATGATATVGHGLGVAPQMIIVKDAASAGNWAVWHTSLASTAYYLFMNTTAAQANTSAIWTGTPSSTTFGIGSWHTADRQIAYCFAPVAGYSAFGSYTGGLTDGAFVYCGFAPRWVLMKNSTSVSDWSVFDTARDTYNVAGKILFPNTAGAELASPPRVDLTSTGFKIRAAPGGIPNESGTYIYMAFAENPTKFANAR